MTPKLTVLMPVYNGEKHLREAVESVLNQTFKDFELLIIDDGSTDHSLQIARNYNDPRICIIKNARNLGVSVTRNKGIQKAEGEYVAMLDCDDIAYPTRFQEQLSFMEKAHDDFAIIGTGVELIDESGRTTDYSLLLHKPEEIPANLLFNNCFAQSSILARKRILLSERYREEIPFSEDYDLWVRIAKKYKTWNLPKILIKHRLHAKSTGHSKRDEMIRRIRIIVSYQLDELGLGYTEDDLDTHLSLGFYEYRCDRAFVERAEAWLQKLNHANKERNVYQQHIFKQVLNQHWLRLCCSSINTGSWILKKAVTSGLSNGVGDLRTLAGFARQYVLTFSARSRLLRSVLKTV